MGETLRIRAVHADGEPVLDVPRTDPLPDPRRVQMLGVDGYDVTLTLAGDAPDAYEVREIAIAKNVGAPPITSSALRSVPVARLTRAAAQFLSIRQSLPGESWGDIEERTMFGRQEVLASAAFRQALELPEFEGLPALAWTEGGVKLADSGMPTAYKHAGPSSDFTADAVAGLYRLGEHLGAAPVRFVGDALGLPGSTASHWVRLARRSGKLEPATRRRRADRLHDA